METEFVERILNAVPELKGWEIGEALAECALGNDAGREVHWPWNTVRDRRTPRARARAAREPSRSDVEPGLRSDQASSR